MNDKKKRLDQLLVEKGLADNCSQARSLIMSGRVFLNERRLDKPGYLLQKETKIVLRALPCQWASRGGFKLEYGLNYFGITPLGKIVLDIGSSTGGFTDVLLTKGASRVYSVDVGYGQLLTRLQKDRRVISLERTNARYLTALEVPEPIDLVACDTSFIGLRTVLPAPLALARVGAQLVALIKPQFEVGRKWVGKKGIVRDTTLQLRACTQISEWLLNVVGWHVLGVIESPIIGVKGNREFLIGATRVHY